MYNAIKTLILVVAAAACAAGCSADHSRADAADRLLTDARAKAAAKDYTAAITLLDTLDKSYRDCLEQRRAGTRLRTEALRDLTIDSIAANDARRQSLQLRIAELEPRFEHVDIGGTGGFSVDKSIYTGDEMSHTVVQPRLDEDGLFYLAVGVAGRTIGITGLRYGDVATRPVSWDGPVIEGSEIMNLSSEYIGDFADAVAATGEQSATVTITGKRGNVPVRLDRKQLDAFRATLDYSRALTAHRNALIARERLERQLHNLRDALANLPEPQKNS